MLGSATASEQTALLQHALGIAAMPMPAAIYIALCTTAPTDTTPGAEVTGGAYARQLMTAAMVSGSYSAAANTATIEYPPATAPWGNVSYLEIWDALTGGGRKFWGPLVDPADGITPITRAIATGDILRLPAGSVVVTAD
jgi:hypothetical protein